MRPRLIALVTALLLTQGLGCKSKPSRWQTEPSESGEGTLAGSASIQWKTVPLPSGNIDLFLLVNDQPYLIEKAARTMRRMPRGDFARQEIPRSAHSAAYFWAAEADEDDAQKMYVRDKGDQVIVYSAYKNPCPTNEEEELETWSIKRTIRYNAAPDEDDA